MTVHIATMRFPENHENPSKPTITCGDLVIRHKVPIFSMCRALKEAGKTGMLRVVLEDGYCVVDDPGKRGARRWRTSALCDLSSSRRCLYLATLLICSFLARWCL